MQYAAKMRGEAMDHVTRHVTDVERTAPQFSRTSETGPRHCFSPPSFFRKGLNRSIGTGRNVVVLCSLEISRMVCR